MTSEAKDKNEVFIELLTLNYNQIRSFILTLVPNTSDADDILQETSKVLWEKFAQFEIGTSFISWALTIAKFQVLNYHKKNNVKVRFGSDIIDILANESKCPLEKEDERLDALRSCLKKLKKNDATLIHYRFIQRKTARELSKMIGMAMNTIYRNESRIVSLLLNCVRKTLGIAEIYE